MRLPRDIAILEERQAARGKSEAARTAEPIAGGWMCFEKIGSWKNTASGLGMEGPVSLSDMETLVAFYTSRGVEPVVEICSYAHSSLRTHLATLGFRLRGFENVLARPLGVDEEFSRQLVQGGPDGITITHLDPTDEAEVWRFIEVATSGFLAPGVPMSDHVLEANLPIIAHPRCDSFGAVFDGQIVGASVVEISPPIASLFLTSVLPSHRRRGIQSALIAHRLHHARELGCEIACIGADPGAATESNAIRLGFSMAYTKAIMVMPGDGLAPAVIS